MNNLGEHITNYLQDTKGLLFDGECWTNNEGKENEETVISGTFLVVRELEFRIKLNFAIPGNGVESLKLTKFDQISGIHIEELNKITDALIEAIRAF